MRIWFSSASTGHSASPVAVKMHSAPIIPVVFVQGKWNMITRRKFTQLRDKRVERTTSCSRVNFEGDDISNSPSRLQPQNATNATAHMAACSGNVMLRWERSVKRCALVTGPLTGRLYGAPFFSAAFFNEGTHPSWPCQSASL